MVANMNSSDSSLIQKEVRWNEDSEVQIYKRGKAKKPLWYTKEEYNGFLEERERIVRMAEEHGVKHVESMKDATCRGLESMFIPKRKLLDRRRDAMRAVFMEQEHQARCSISSPEAIAQCYFLECEESTVEAHKIALIHRRQNQNADRLEKASTDDESVCTLTSKASEKSGTKSIKKLLSQLKAVTSATKVPRSVPKIIVPLTA